MINWAKYFFNASDSSIDRLKTIFLMCYQIIAAILLLFFFLSFALMFINIGIIIGESRIETVNEKQKIRAFEKGVQSGRLQLLNELQNQKKD